MEKSLIQERQDNERVKEIYDTALAQLMTGSMPIIIHIRQKEASRLSAAIIQQNLPIDNDIIIYVYAIDSGTSPSDYLAGLYSETDNEIKLVEEQRIVRYFELPSILEKSYKVDTQSRILSTQGKKNGKDARLSISGSDKTS
jgi:hypothetical protein